MDDFVVYEPVDSIRAQTVKSVSRVVRPQTNRRVASANHYQRNSFIGQRPTSMSVENSPSTQLQTFYYTYTTHQGNRKQFAIKKKITEPSQPADSFSHRPASSVHSRALLSNIYKDHDDSFEMQINSKGTFALKQWNQCQRLNTKLNRPSSALKQSYVDFCLFQSQQQDNLSGSFYIKDQILQLVDDEEQLAQKREELKQIPYSKKITQVTQQSNDVPMISEPAIDGQTKIKFREMLNGLDQEQRKFKVARDGPDMKEMNRDVMNAVLLGGEQAQEQIQQHVKKWLERQHNMLGEMQQHIDDFKDMMKELPDKSGQSSPNKSLKGKQLWMLKRDLVKRVGYLSKVLKKADSSLPSKGNVQKTQSIYDTESQASMDSIDKQMEQEKKSFIYQLLAIEEPAVKAPAKIDAELEKKRNEYWQFDRKGRNLKQLRDKTMRSKMKKYGVIFSRDVKSKFDRMRELLIQCVRKLKLMRISAEELMSDRVILKKPYQREGAYVFFKAVERCDIDLVKLSLKQCRYFVFDLDYNLQTALHIAARKGDAKLATELLKEGAYPDKTDLAGRTPLWYALFHKNPEVVRINQLILYNQGNPWSFKGCDYQAATESQDMLKLLKIARRLNILLMMTPYVDRGKVWTEYRELFMRLGKRASRQF